ncbi:MAG: polyprenyl diphosphate synthase [Candidatus Aenigmarchaeota archaeon]|nr:polyprenyl diphosphate synthase [Candidatus Aenigmarchaeota archaeon]
MNGMIVPKHVAVILDGNRRWAAAHNMKPWEGHRHGAQTLDKFLDWCLELNVEQVSAYVLSSENLNRPRREVIELLKLLKHELNRFETERAAKIDKYEIKVRFCGDFSRLPNSLVKIMGRIMTRTEKYNKKFLNILIAYGGRYELTSVIKNLVAEAVRKRLKITEKTIEENLLISGDVDLVIRTGGMSRLSNFMPWQTTYSEFYVTKVLWPDFTKNDLIKAIKWFNNMKRNFGK